MNKIYAIANFAIEKRHKRTSFLNSKRTGFTPALIIHRYMYNPL